MTAKRAERERVEKERLEALKQKEVQRITEERRRNEKPMDIVNGKILFSSSFFSEFNSNTKQFPPLSSGVSEKPPIFSSPMVKTNNNQQMQLQQAQQNNSYNAQPEQVGITVQKSNSVANIFGDRLRRSSEPNKVKRAESMKTVPKTPKRTPSFTTRRRAQSFRKNQAAGDLDLPPVEIQGMLERKHELQSGGKRAPVRSWKPFHTVLCGQLLCFFKDEEDFFQKKAATAPVNILNANCEKAENYTKKKNVFRLKLPDGSEFLFLAASKEDMVDWVNKISFHAALPPNLQLLSYDESMKVSVHRIFALKFHQKSKILIFNFFVTSNLPIHPIPKEAITITWKHRQSVHEHRHQIHKDVAQDTIQSAAVCPEAVQHHKLISFKSRRN